MELSAPDARHSSGGRGEHRHLRRDFSDRAADARVLACAGFDRPADRRNRPRRPGVRGVPARIPLRLQISIPERGTVRAAERPVVVLTSNRTRDLHEALRRRCVYHWIDYPTAEREARIVMMRASSVAEATARAVVAAVGRLRREPLSKAPGIAEAVDWAEAATLLHQGGARWPDAFKRSIGVALKDEEDLTFISGRLDALLAEAAA